MSHPSEQAVPKPRLRRAVPRAPHQPVADVVHRDIAELAGAVRELAETLKPLKVLADHAPTLVEMAERWNAGKVGVRAVGRLGTVTGAVAKWVWTVGSVFALVWLAIHGKWAVLLKGIDL